MPTRLDVEPRTSPCGSTSAGDPRAAYLSGVDTDASVGAITEVAGQLAPRIPAGIGHTWPLPIRPNCSSITGFFLSKKAGRGWQDALRIA